MKNFVLLIFFFILTSAFSQDKAALFSVEIKKHYQKFVANSNIAYEKGDNEKGQKLYDSLVHNFLVGTKLDSYKFKRINGNKVNLKKLNKPALIITYASWCVMNKAEIPAINTIAKKYSKDFDVIILFWDKKKNIKKLASKFNVLVKVCYANDSYLDDEEIVATLKHYLGFPTSYFINENLQIVDIERGSPQIPIRTPFKKALEIDMTFFQKRITNFLIQKDIIKDSYTRKGD
jgi:thiol-disulfide isomerase/thioredoxin